MNVPHGFWYWAAVWLLFAVAAGIALNAPAGGEYFAGAIINAAANLFGRCGVDVLLWFMD